MPKLRTMRTRPAVAVRICAVSRSSPLAPPCVSTRADTVSRHPSAPRKAWGYTGTPSSASEARFARRCDALIVLLCFSHSPEFVAGGFDRRPTEPCGRPQRPRGAGPRFRPPDRPAGRSSREPAPDRVEHPVHEARRRLAAERPGQLDRLVDHHGGGGLGREQLVHRQPEDEPVDHRHAREAPVVGGRLDERIDPVQRLQGPPQQAIREPAGIRPGPGADASRGPPRGRTAALRPRRPRAAASRGGRGPSSSRAAPRRRRPRAGTATAGPPPVPGDGPRGSAPAPLTPGTPPRRRGFSSRNRRTIASAASAASHPLFDGPAPARASASSTELVVSTPKAIGTPLSSAAWVRPWATAAAITSKCGVSPRIRQPRPTTASTSPAAASRRAPCGTSNAPGTGATTIASSSTPAARNASVAPACSRSVTKS